MSSVGYARRVLSSIIVVTVFAAGSAGATEKVRAADARASSYWKTATSENFSICCPRDVDAEQIVKDCEAWRTKLMDYWLGAETAHERWPTRCYLVLHPNLASYVQALGRGAEQTYGTSTLKEEDGKVASRRIDLRLDREDAIRRVLPHEMTHVVLAEIISRSKTPRWADEGMAMLSDLPSKQSLHERDFTNALQSGSSFRLLSLLGSSEYPNHDVETFYGESLSLTRFLVDRESPVVFLGFVQHAAAIGYDAALRDDYGIRDVAELEKIWIKSQRSLTQPEDRFGFAAR